MRRGKRGSLHDTRDDVGLASWIPPGWTTFCREVRLPSYVPGAEFTAAVRAAWYAEPDEPTCSADAVALRVLAHRAAETTTRYAVTYIEVAEAAVNASLNRPCTTRRETDGCTISVLGRISLTATEQARLNTDDYFAVQRDEQSRSGRQAIHLRSLKALLADRGIAHLWWADRNPELLTAFTDGTLSALMEHLPQQHSDDAETIASILHDFLTSMKSDDHSYALVMFEMLLQKLDAVEELRRLRQLREAAGARDDGRAV